MESNRMERSPAQFSFPLLVLCWYVYRHLSPGREWWVARNLGYPGLLLQHQAMTRVCCLAPFSDQALS